MELFKSGLKTVLGSSSKGSSQDRSGDEGAETVEKLVERLETSTLLEDRRGACRALRSLSKKYRVEVGAQGMDALLNALSVDRTDPEIVAYALESLLNVTHPESLEDEDPNLKTMGKQFTEILTKKSENVVTLLSIMDEYDFRIRLPAIRLMTNLLLNKPKDIQEILLISPMGVSKVMDLISDTREVVRNDALLLLTALTKSNANIQKIIAFENGFDRIIQIIESEGYSDGGPIVEDSLHLFLNLLKGNTSNQTFFREGNYIKKLLPFFTNPDENDIGWPTQKVANVYHMLQIIRTLVSPLNPSQVTLSCQKSMKSCGILESLCNIIMAFGVPAETLTEAIVTVAESIRGCQENQAYFASVVAPSDPPRPILLILLMTLLSEGQQLTLRCAELYCVQSYLYKNEKSQEDIVKTLLPSSADAMTSLTAGQLLCSGLFSKDPTNNWFAASSLSHALIDNPVQKDSLLQVQLATKANSPPIRLIDHIVATIQQTNKSQVKIAFLQFLSVWLESCSTSITQFLSNSSSIPYLITQITSGDSEDKEIFIQGLSAFVLGLCLYFNPDTVPSFTKCEELVNKWDAYMLKIATELSKLEGVPFPPSNCTIPSTLGSKLVRQEDVDMEDAKENGEICDINMENPSNVSRDVSSSSSRTYQLEKEMLLNKFDKFAPEEQVDCVKTLICRLSRENCKLIFDTLAPVLKRDFISLFALNGFEHLADHILLYLDGKSLCNAEMVSKQWTSTINTSLIWKKKIEQNIKVNKLWRDLSDCRPWIQHLMRPRQAELLQYDGSVFKKLYMDIILDLKYAENVWENRENFKPKVTKINCGTTRSEIKGVYCMQYDSKKIVAGKRDTTIQVYDKETRKQTNLLTGHSGAVLCLQFDDNILITGSSDATIRIWDIDTGNLLKTVIHHREAVLNLRFGAGLLISSSKDKTIAVWSIISPTNLCLKQTLFGHRSAVNVIDFDDKYIVSGAGDRTIKIWSTSTCVFYKNLEGHQRGIACLQYKDNLIVSGSSDCSIKIWNADEGTCIRTLRGHLELVRCIRFDHRHIVSGCYDGSINIWNMKAAMNPNVPNSANFCLNTLNEHDGRVFRVQFDDFKIISSSYDDSFIVWDFLGPHTNPIDVNMEDDV